MKNSPNIFMSHKESSEVAYRILGLHRRVSDIEQKIAPRGVVYHDTNPEVDGFSVVYRVHIQNGLLSKEEILDLSRKLDMNLKQWKRVSNWDFESEGSPLGMVSYDTEIVRDFVKVNKRVAPVDDFAPGALDGEIYAEFKATVRKICNYNRDK